MCAEQAATDAELADRFGVSITTLNTWKSVYPEFSLALKNGKAPADDRVERSLYHRAMGYTFDSEKIFQYQGKVVRVVTREHVPPDTAAAFIWLKNRRPQDWRDKQELEVTGNFSELTDEQIESRLKELLVKTANAPAGN